MAKFHISKDGKVNKCTANVKACPVGGEHFASASEALQAVESKAKKEFTNTFKSLNKNSTQTNQEPTLTSLQAKIKELGEVPGKDLPKMSTARNRDHNMEYSIITHYATQKNNFTKDNYLKLVKANRIPKKDLYEYDDAATPEENYEKLLGKYIKRGQKCSEEVNAVIREQREYEKKLNEGYKPYSKEVTDTPPPRDFVDVQSYAAKVDSGGYVIENGKVYEIFYTAPRTVSISNLRSNNMVSREIMMSGVDGVDDETKLRAASALGWAATGSNAAMKVDVNPENLDSFKDAANGKGYPSTRGAAIYTNSDHLKYGLSFNDENSTIAKLTVDSGSKAGKGERISSFKNSYEILKNNQLNAAP